MTPFGLPHKFISIEELGYSIKVPDNFSIDGPRNGTYCWITVDGKTEAGIQRWPNTFSYDDFVNEIKSFSHAYKSEIIKGDNPNEIHHVINDGKTRFFVYTKTRYYHFYYWANSLEILTAIKDGLSINETILAKHFDQGIDYPIKGSEVIQFLTRQTTISRSSLNIFQMNIDTSYYINPYLMSSEGTLYSRYKNIYAIGHIPTHVKKLLISINASDKTGVDQLNFRKEFEVVD